MNARVIDGRAVASGLLRQLKEQVVALQCGGINPGLAVILLGSDPASETYVRSKVRCSAELGIVSFEHRLKDTVTEAELLTLIRELNADDLVDGILVQLPLPKHIDTRQVLLAIDPMKDVDGFNPLNTGRLFQDLSCFVPCTPLGCLHLIRAAELPLVGVEAVVIGRSTIVGRPMAALLMTQDATVTIVHSKTRNARDITRRADLVVVAIGQPNYVTADWLKPGAVVIDVGINRISTSDGKTRLVGDVDFESAIAVAGSITPVPGGVGPMTIACLMENTLAACIARRSRKSLSNN